MGQAPFALLGALTTAPGGATALLPVARLLARNLPLVLLLVMIAALFWPSGVQSEQPAEPEDTEAGNTEAGGELGRPVPLRPVLEHA